MLYTRISVAFFSKLKFQSIKHLAFFLSLTFCFRAVNISLRYSSSSQVQGQARLPPWRGREIWGCVMGTPHPRLGQYGMALRDGDEHEPWWG